MDVRQMTPVEMLESDLNSIFCISDDAILCVSEKKKSTLKEIIEKAKEYEQQYYGDGSTNSLKKENELLKVRNKVLADFIKNSEEFSMFTDSDNRSKMSGKGEV